MPVSLTTLTGPIYMPDGATPVGGRVSFELSSWDREVGEALIISGPAYSDIDENGQFSVELFTTTEGVNTVNYKMYVLWEDSALTQSYVNDVYVNSPAPHYTKKYIGSFALAGVGPFRVSDLNIVSELELSSFDVLLECQAYATAAAVSATASAAAVDAVTPQVSLSSTAVDLLSDHAEGRVSPKDFAPVAGKVILGNPNGYYDNPRFMGAEETRAAIGVSQAKRAVVSFFADSKAASVTVYNAAGATFYLAETTGTINHVDDDGIVTKWALSGPAIFENRAQAMAFIAAIDGVNGSTFAVGDQIGWDGLLIEYDGVSTYIDDMTGWVPVGDITAAHWGIDRDTTDDVTVKLQAMIDYAESIAVGLRDRVQVFGTGAPMTVTAPLVNALASLDFQNWQLVAADGTWGSLTYATTDILGDPHPVALAMMQIGGRYAGVPVAQNISPAFGEGFSLDCNRLAMGGIAMSGVTEPQGDVSVEGALVYHMFLGKTLSCKWSDTISFFAASVSSDENTPCFRTARGLWNGSGDNFIGVIHSSYCRENIYTENSPLFMGYAHAFGGWKGDGPNWGTWVAGTTTITVDGDGGVLTFPVTTGGAGHAVGDTLYIEKWAGDSVLDYAQNRHQDPDNWPGLAVVVVTSVDGAGAITGLRIVADRWGNEGRGAGYSAGVCTLYHIQSTSPINIRLRENGGLSLPTLYLDKGIALMEGTFKLRATTCHFVADDELSFDNMLVFRTKTGKENNLINFEMQDVHYNFSRAYGSYDPRGIIFTDETEGAFVSAAPVIGCARPNSQSNPTLTFPTTKGVTTRQFNAEAISGVAGGYYVDIDLGGSGFAGELYRLPSAKTLRFSSTKDNGKTFNYRYLSDNPLVATAITDTTARRHTVRVYLDDATRDGGDVIRCEWLGIDRATESDGDALITGPAYISIPDPENTPIDPSALWTGANAGVLGEWWSSRSGLYTDLAATIPCAVDGDIIQAWVGKRGILTATSATGLTYKIDSNGVPYVYCDGGIKRLLTPDYDMSSVGVVTLFAGVVNLQDAASATIFNSNGLLTQSWRLNVPSNTSGGVSAAADGGAALTVSDSSIALKPHRLIATAVLNLAAGTETLTVNNRTQKTTSGSFGGATTWGNKPISLGGKATGTSSFPTAQIYELGFFGKTYTDDEKIAARKLLANATRVVL